MNMNLKTNMNKTYLIFHILKTLTFGVMCSLIVSSTGCSSFLAATHNDPIRQDPGQRSRGEAIDDKQITTFLRVNLTKADPAFEKANVNFVSYNGVVLLTGEVPSKALRELAAKTARDISAVRLVHNQLNIASKSTIYSRTYDSWLATKVKTKIINNQVIEANRVKIIVENRVVYIMGLVTEKEAAAISEIASTTDGVTKVVRAVELIPEHERAPI